MTSSPLRVVAFRTLADIAPLAPQLDAINLASRRPSPFATFAYLLAGGDDIWDRNVTPSASDTFFGFAFLLLVLEACRRTSGWIMTFVIGAFVAYAFAGPWLPGEWSHRGYDIANLSGFLYQTLDPTATARSACTT